MTYKKRWNVFLLTVALGWTIFGTGQEVTAAEAGQKANIKVSRTAGVQPASKVKTEEKAKTPIKQTEKQNSLKNSSEKKAPEPIIRVRLISAAKQIGVSGNTETTILGTGGKQWKTEKSNVKLAITAKGKEIYINGKKVGSQAVLKGKEAPSSSVFYVNGKPYRGSLRAVADGSGSVMLINEVPLEAYLYGVVPEEAPPSWPIAALQAQAVAARTYALHNMEKNKKKTYDVEPTIWSQVYNGKNSEYPSTNRAVDMTRGMVLTYAGKPIDALFHSNGGGYTESSVHVWGNPVPYLQGVSDESKHSDTYSWLVKTSREDIEKRLAKLEKSIGTLKEIKLSALKKRPMSVSDRGVSGRVKTAQFVGSKGTVSVSGEEIQGMFGLRSTLFDFYVNYEPKKDVDQITDSKTWHSFGKGNQIVYIKGYGWGHGLGLSQWGAAGMATKAGKDERFYEKILLHYYRGAKLEKLY